MSSTRPSIARLFKIHQAIGEKSYPTAEELADLCEVTVRTVKRDVRELREAYGAPVAYSRRYDGYYYSHEFNLTSLPLSEGELLAVCMMRAMADTFRNTPMAPALQRALHKLQVMLPETAQAGFNDDALSISCLPEATAPERVETCIHFNTLLRAMEDHRQVRMTYFAMSRNAVSTRIVNPYHVFYRRGMWYLYGWCHLRRAMRDFALERVQDLELLAATFPPPDLAAVRDEIARRFSLISDVEISTAIWFDADWARRIRERVWHPTQRIEDHPDGTCTLHMTVEGLQSVVRWVLAFGHHAKPLAPPALVEQVKAEAHAVVAMLGE